MVIGLELVGLRTMQGWYTKLTAAQQNRHASCTTGFSAEQKIQVEHIPVFKESDLKLSFPLQILHIVKFYSIGRLTVRSQHADI